jgi:PAS domain S-box-containing protein
MASMTPPDDQLSFELFELLPDAILVVDRQGVIRYANGQAGQVFGREPRSLVSAPVEALLPEHLRERHVDHRRKYASDPHLRPMGAGLDLAGRRADGTTFPVDIMLSPIKHLDEPMVLAVVRDVTDRRAREEALRKNRTMFETLYEGSPDAIFAVNESGSIDRVNAPAEILFRLPRERLLGQPIEMLLPERFRDRHLAHRAGYMKDAKTRPMGSGLQLWAQRGDGSEFPVDIMLSPIEIDQRRLVLAVVRDITERRVAEEELRKNRVMFETLYEGAPDAIFVVDEIGRIDRVNAAAETSFGLPRERLLGQSVEMLLPERFRDRHLAHRAAYMRDAKTRPMGTGLQLSAQRADGSEFPVDIMLSPVEIEHRRMVLAVVRDVTGRRNSEEARARLAAIVTSSEDAIISMTLDGVVTTWNEAAERMLGYSAGEMIGQPIRHLIPADRQAEEDLILDRVAHGKRIGHYETVRNAKDGQTIDVSVTISPMRDTKGRIIGASKIVRDIRARKQAEETLRLLMRESNHRVKNMLSLVQAIARQTAGRESEDFVGRFSERIQALAANQDLLVRNEWQGVEVEDLVRAQLAPFADLVGSRIAMLGPKLHLNSAAAQAIGLALHELATNAGKYGALSTNKGHVDVCWGTDGDALTMSWTERDGPRVSPPQRRGFGSTVIASMAEAAVGGEVHLDYAPSGLVWRLTCPTANGLESGEREQFFGKGKIELNGATDKVPPLEARNARR